MTSFGAELRAWRKRNRYTQMDLAAEAEVSTRHLSCVETGKSSPSRLLVLTLAETLGVPLEETNHWLALAGFAPAFRNRGLEGPDAQPVRTAIEFLLRQHHPYPVVAVDPGWTVVLANDAYLALAMWLAGGPVRPAERGVVHDGPPVAGSNALLPLFDPAGLRSRVVNFEAFSAHMVQHLRRAARDEPLAATTLDALERLAGPTEAPEHTTALPVVVPLELESQGTTLRLFTSMTLFGSSVDTVLASLRLETFFPADDATDAKLRELFG